MWQQKQAELLKEEIEKSLSPLINMGNFYKLLKESLLAPVRGLSPGVSERSPFPLLPLMVAEAVTGSCEIVLPAAASLQFLMAAGDIFDDIEDADSPTSIPARYGNALAVNAATALLILAERTLTRLKLRGVDAASIVRVADSLNSYYTTACAGQHLDLSLDSVESISEEEYLNIISLKSASQVECACYIGAALTTGNQSLVDTFAGFGQNLGMAAQITNDIRGTVTGSDILKGKLNLPLVYALAISGAEERRILADAIQKPARPPEEVSRIKDSLFRSGAVYYAEAKKEFYKQKALDNLQAAEMAGADIHRLKMFLG